VQPALVVNVVNVDEPPSEKIAEGADRPPSDKTADGVVALTLDVGKALQDEACDLVGSRPETEKEAAGSSLGLDLTMRSLTASKRHQCLSRSLEPATNSLATPRHSEELRQNQLKVKHLKKEVQSLRDVYSRQMSCIEMRCERMLQEKDDERNAWWKEKKGEIRRMQACSVIMQSLFNKRKRVIESREKKQREAHARKEAEFKAHLEALEKEAKAAQEAAEAELAEKTAAFERKVDDLLQDRAALQRRNSELENDVAKWRGEAERAQLHCVSMQQRVEALKEEVLKAEKAEEIARKDAQIDALEMDLKFARKQLRDAKHQEAESIRKELMECVKFIGQILPEEWRTRGVATGVVDQLPTDLQQHVLRPEYPKSARGVPDATPRSTGLTAQLPPVGGQTWPGPRGAIAAAQDLAPMPSARRRRPNGQADGGY